MFIGHVGFFCFQGGGTALHLAGHEKAGFLGSDFLIQQVWVKGESDY